MVSYSHVGDSKKPVYMGLDLDNDVVLLKFFAEKEKQTNSAQTVEQFEFPKTYRGMVFNSAKDLECYMLNTGNPGGIL